MKAVFSGVGRECRLVLRSGISVFMAAAPAILALVFLLVFGAVGRTTLRLAVDDTVDEASKRRLETVADVERFSDAARMEARLRAADAVAGVTMEDGEAVVVFAGDEGTEFMRSAGELVGLALAAPEGGVSYQSQAVEANGGLAYRVSLLCILLLSLFVGGATVGLSIVDERESGAIRAVAVSPMRLGGYALSKLIPALLFGLAGITGAALITGQARLLPAYLLLTLASALVSGMMAFLLGAFAANQIAAIGVLKLLVPLGMILPVSAVFVSEKWQVFYYILPMYWQYRALSAVLAGTGAAWPTILTLLVSVPWFAAAVWLFIKKAGFRRGR